MSDGIIEICIVDACDKPAAVLVDVELVYMNEEGVQALGTEIVAMCRSHAMEERRRQESLS